MGQLAPAALAYEGSIGAAATATARVAPTQLHALRRLAMRSQHPWHCSRPSDRACKAASS